MFAARADLDAERPFKAHAAWIREVTLKSVGEALRFVKGQGAGAQLGDDAP